MKINIEENLIEDGNRNSISIENEFTNFLESNERNSIKADIELLKSMGFDKKMINKIYVLLRPENIERAIDYMTEIDGVYQHNFVNNINQKENNICFICKKPKKNHLDYIPEELLIDAQIDNNQINNRQLSNNIQISEGINKIIEENKKDNIDDDFLLDECQVCYDELTKEDKDLNKIKCGHLFCSPCWFNYLKTLILEAKVDNISCMDHGCKEIMTEDFILKHISKDDNLILKYNKFKKRAEIIKDKDKKLCPNPDCDSFLKKSNSSKYVQCQNGHKYCFDCLNPPHGKNPCEQKLEKQFMKWKKGKRVKRCPRCQMYTEKNEGCNHMSCINCKYQWCWICEEKYIYGHYNSGRCKGQQFTKADNLRDIEKYRNAFGLHKIFKCVFQKINGPYDLDEYIWLKYLLILGFWIFGFGFLFVYVVVLYAEKNLKKLIQNSERLFFLILFLIGLCLCVCFQILFACTLTPFILIAFVNHKFFERILIFYGVGETDV